MTVGNQEDWAENLGRWTYSVDDIARRQLYNHKRLGPQPMPEDWFDEAAKLLQESLRSIKTHELKTWPEYFQAVKSGIKTFEIRKNDRDYQVGDRLWLKEWSPETQEYTGDALMVFVTYVLHGGQFGVEEGYVVIGISF